MLGLLTNVTIKIVEMTGQNEPKTKSSLHHEERLWDPKHPRHGLPIEGCHWVIHNYDSVVEQENGRFMYVGDYLGETHEVVVSAAVSANGPVIVEVNRVVTAYNIEDKYYLSDWTPPEENSK